MALRAQFYHVSLAGNQLSPLWGLVRNISPSCILCTQGGAQEARAELQQTPGMVARRGGSPDSCPARGYFHCTGTLSLALTPWELPWQGIVQCPVSTPQPCH